MVNVNFVDITLRVIRACLTRATRIAINLIQELIDSNGNGRQTDSFGEALISSTSTTRRVAADATGPRVMLMCQLA